MNVLALTQPAVTVIVLGASDAAAITATVRSLLVQTEPVEVLVVCDEPVGGELIAGWRTTPPAGLRIVPVPASSPPTQRADIGSRQARGAFLGVAPAGALFHPRHFTLMLASVKARPGAGGVCLRREATDPPPCSWVLPLDGCEGVAELFNGSFAVETLLAPAETLRTYGARHSADRGWLFVLALRVALREGLHGVELPSFAWPTLPTAPAVAELDAAVADWMQSSGAPPNLGPLRLMVLRPATSEGWPLTRRAVSAHVDALAGGLSLAVAVPRSAARWRAEMHDRLPQGAVFEFRRGEGALPALVRLAETADAADYVMVATEDPPDLDRLMDMCLRMEAARLDACLPVSDDGLLRAPSPGSLIPGTLFRRKTLADILSEAVPQVEHGFWMAFDRRGIADAVTITSPNVQSVTPNEPWKAPSGRFVGLPGGKGGESRAPFSPAGHRRWRRIVRALESAGRAVRRSGIRLLARFRRVRPPLFLRRRVDPMPLLVDGEWYVRRLPDGLPAGMSASDHYRQTGWREGLDPNPFFSTRWYLDANPDIRAMGTCPLDHYVIGGAAEMLARRSPHPFFDPVWYAQKYGVQEHPAYAPLADFVAYGARRGHVPNPLFEHEAVRKHLAGVDARDRGDELVALWNLRNALARDAQVYSPELVKRFSTVILWELPERATPVARTSGEITPEPASIVVRLRSHADRIVLAFGPGDGRNILLLGETRRAHCTELLTAIGARFDAGEIDRNA